MAKQANYSNGFDNETVKKFLARIDNLYEGFETKRADFRNDLKALYEDAEEKHLPVDELKKLVKVRRDIAKHERMFEALDAEARERMEQLAIPAGLDDLPLFKAADERAAAAE